MRLFEGLAVVCCTLLFGCTDKFTVPVEHVVMYESDGAAVNPIGNDGEGRHSLFKSYDRYTDREYQSHIDRILLGIEHAEHPRNSRIMIFIHGGMNTQVGSLKRLYEEFEVSPESNGTNNRIKLIKDKGYYPIFVNWKSSLWSSYAEHLLRIRQGQRWPRLWGWPSALVILPIDITRSLVRAPLVWGMQIYNDILTVGSLVNGFPPSLSDSVSKELLCRFNLKEPLANCVNDLHFKKPPYCVPWTINAEPPPFRPSRRDVIDDTFRVTVGEDRRGCLEMDGHFASYLLTFPFKLAIGPVLDTFGSSAWLNMQRRIHLLFRSEDELVALTSITDEAKKKDELAMIPASGGLSVFIKALKQHMEGRDWEVVLVGHSMGAIVINELLRLHGDDLPISHIVYLAGAASIRDYEDSVFPYLKNHQEAKFYNFALHPIVERSEIQSNMLDLPPRGTLLNWLDNFLANPQTLRDRTVGNYENFVPTMHDAPHEIRSRIHFRSFSAGMEAEAENPQNHSHAAERFRFWESECWDVEAPLKECVRTNK